MITIESVVINLGADTAPLETLLKEIKVNQAEMTAAINAAADQLAKVKDEIQASTAQMTAAIEAAGQSTPQMDAALQRLQSLSADLDALNPDAPPPVGGA